MSTAAEKTAAAVVAVARRADFEWQEPASDQSVYLLRAGGLVVVAIDERVYVSGVSGAVYRLHERGGEILWYPLNDPAGVRPRLGPPLAPAAN